MLVCEYDTIIQGSNQCKKSVGGVRKSWGIDWQNVESVQGLAETGTITGLTLKEGKTLKVLEYDNDNTASYNQTTNRVGLDARVEQVATLKFTGANVEKSVIANKAKGVHNGLWFHLQNDGTIHSQGAEFGAKGDKIITSLVGAKVNPNINSNTGEGSSDVTWNIVSTSTDIVPVMMTMEDLDALVGEDTGDSDMGGSDIGDSDILGLPSVMILPVSGSIVTVIWDNGGDPSATRTLTIGTTGFGPVSLPTTDGDVDLRCENSLFVGSTYTLDINASIVNIVGSDSDSSIGAVVLTYGAINGVTFSPVVEITPPSSNILQAPIVVFDGCCCGLSSVTYSFSYSEFGGTSQILFPGYFPINLLSWFCGNTGPTSEVWVRITATNNMGQVTSQQLLVANVTVDGGGIVTSVNGVSC